MKQLVCDKQLLFQFHRKMRVLFTSALSMAADSLWVNTFFSPRAISSRGVLSFMAAWLLLH